MARPIDEKIVVMKLDNSDFTQKAAETTSMFGKLRDALSKIPGVNLGKTAQDLGAIQDQANPTNLNRLGDAVNTVANRFSTLGIMGVTALQNITNRAVDAGIALTKSLTLDQVTSGFSEYELKIGAIGTMLSNTEWEGGNLESIKVVLEDLNTYADNTVYSFANMTENIGRFTAAGVGMKDSAIAIKGLSNLAAASGSDVNQLNTAMYQMSQAMAAGTINLMDWNSLVNAGMGGKKTQDALLATAKAMGVNVDMSEGFRNSISDGWITSELLLETFKKFGEDKSMTEAATAVRTFSGMMDSLKESIGSGWATTWETIFGDFEEATTFWTNLSNVVTGFFSKSTKSRNDFLEGLSAKGGIDNIFAGLANAAKPVGQIFKAIGDGFGKAFPPKTVSQVANMAKSFKEFTAGLTLSSSTVKKLTTVFQGVFAVFSSVIEIAKRLGKAFIKIIPEGAGGGVLNLLEKIALLSIAFNESLKEGNAFTDGIDVIGNVLKTLGDVLSTIGKAIFNFGGFIKDDLGGAIDWLKDKLAPVGKFFKEAFGESLGDEALGAGTLIAAFAIVKKITGFFDNMNDGLGDILDNVSGMFEGLGDALNAFATGVKFVNLLLIATAVAVLAASLKTMEGIETEDLVKGITALAVSLGIMMGAMVLMTKFNVTGGMGAALTMIALATAVNIMAKSLKRVADLKPDELKRGVAALVGVTATLAGAMIAMSKWGGKIGPTSLSLVALAGAVVILVGAIETMSAIDTGKLFIAIGALTLIFAQIAIFLKVVGKSKFGPGAALGVLGVAAAIKLLVGAIDSLGGMDLKELAKGLGAVAILLVAIGAFSMVAGGPKMMAAGVGILLIAGAVNALIGPIESLSKMSMAELAKGIGGMAIAILALAGAGLLATGAIGGALAITVMAVALNLLMVPIEKFANMTWGDMLKGFVGLAAGMALLAGAAMLLTPAVPSMLGFGLALGAIGLAVALAGGGIALFGLGLATLATMTATSVAAIVSALGLLLVGLATLIPAAVDFIVKLGMALITGLTTLVPPLINGIITIVMALLNALNANLPQFIQVGAEIVVNLINGLGTALPLILDAAINFIVQVIEGMANAIQDNGPQLLNAIMGLVGEIIILVVQAGAEVISAFFGWIPGVNDAMEGITSGAEEYIRSNFGAGDVASQKGNEFASGLSGTSGKASSAGATVGNAARTGADGISLTAAGTGAGSEFANGLGSKTGASRTSGVGLANAGKTGAGSVSLSATGSSFGSGFASGIGSAIGAVTTAAKNLAVKAKNAVEKWLDINSPSRVMRKDGGWFGEGFALGIRDSISTVSKSARGLAVEAKDTVNDFLSTFNIPDYNNEVHFKAVVDYDKLDPSGFGTVAPIPVQPDTRYTSGLITAAKVDMRQNDYNKPTTTTDSNSDTTTPRQPAVIQVVTPDKREVAKWVVDDVTEFQEFNILRTTKF